MSTTRRLNPWCEREETGKDFSGFGDGYRKKQRIKEWAYNHRRYLVGKASTRNNETDLFSLNDTEGMMFFSLSLFLSFALILFSLNDLSESLYR